MFERFIPETALRSRETQEITGEIELIANKPTHCARTAPVGSQTHANYARNNPFNIQYIQYLVKEIIIIII